MRYKWGYKQNLKKTGWIHSETLEKIYSVTFSNLEADAEKGEKPSFLFGWDEFVVLFPAKSPTKTLRAACSEFRTELEIRKFVGAL